MKIYQLSKNEAIRKGFTEKQWRNSVRGKANWDKRSEGSKFRQVNALLRGRGLPERQYLYEFKVYGYEDTATGTASKLEGVYTYRGDKTIEELERSKDDLFTRVINKVGGRKVGKKKYNVSKVSMGFSEKRIVRGSGEVLRGDYVSLGIGNAAGSVIQKNLGNIINL